MSWSPALMETPSLHSLVIGSEGVEVTVMEKETSCALWYSRHTAPESVKRVKSIKQILVKNKMEAERLSQC